MNASTRFRLADAFWAVLLFGGVFVAWVLYAKAEPAELRKVCEREYQAARTTADSDRVDRWIPNAGTKAQSSAPVSCKVFRVAEHTGKPGAT